MYHDEVLSSSSDWGSRGDVPEVVEADASVALGSGYGESKWVAERILDVARMETALDAVIARVGQLCGNTRNGFWSPTEWFPAMVLASRTTGCVPLADGVS